MPRSHPLSIDPNHTLAEQPPDNEEYETLKNVSNPQSIRLKHRHHQLMKCDDIIRIYFQTNWNVYRRQIVHQKIQVPISSISF